MQSRASPGRPDDAAFGTLAPSPIEELARRIGHRAPAVFWGRWLCSLLLWPSGGRSGRAFDVAVFGTQKARLHPHDNICEKRVFIAPHFWDPSERAALRQFIASGAGPLAFVDVGANAGLYALFAASAARAAGRAICVVAIEPAAVMRARMAFNFAASSVDATILPFAATSAPGPVGLAVNLENRGMSRIAETGGERVEGRPLYALVSDGGLAAVDVMKIDIEGGEFAALSAFFRDAPQSLHPKLLIAETSQDDPAHSAKALVLDNGYAVKLETRQNTIFERRYSL